MIPKRLPTSRRGRFYGAPAVKTTQGHLGFDGPEPAGPPLAITGPAGWLDVPCYYVSVVDGPRRGFLAGPFPSHDEAMAMVDAANRLACDLDPMAWFYGYGTAKSPDGRLTGRLNDLLGITIVRDATVG